MDHKIKIAFLVVGMHIASPILADVICSYENTAIVETTPSSDFIGNGDGTVTHSTTGLTWMRCSLGQIWDGIQCAGSAGIFDWRSGLQTVAEINSGISDDDGDGQRGFAGRFDWRLPNKNELESIIERRCWNPAINADIFDANSLLDEYWSSSPYAGDPLHAWYVSFKNGAIRTDYKLIFNHIRLVRTAQ